MSIFRAFIAVLLLYPRIGAAMEQIKFILSVDNFKMVMTVVNIGSSIVTINKKFSLGPAGKRGEIELYFTSSGGAIHALSAKINYRKISDADLAHLSPGKSISKEIDYSKLKEFYDLSPGVYSVKGIYKNNSLGEKGALIGEIESLPITIDIK